VKSAAIWSPYPFLLILGQDDNEQILGDALRNQGITIQWNTELVDLEQRTDQVTAALKQAAGTIREVAAAWVAGCDGAHSAVRDLNRIAFRGAPYEHVFFVADTRASGPMVPGELNVYLWRKDFTCSSLARSRSLESRRDRAAGLARE
jgi:2-polyprenyl-6-methoxyphenol hydroxylase-like FAD-dependent oxidoreductase